MWAQINSAPSPTGEMVDGEAEKYAAAPVGDYIGATLFAFFSAGACFYWAGFTLNNTFFVNEYTSLNQFSSGRYSWIFWWPVWLLTFNVSLPMLFAFAVTYSNVRVWSRIHAMFSYLVILANVYSLVVLSIGWAFFCNNSGTGIHTACNDYRWCGVYFASGGFCTNGLPFPGLTSGMLSRNQQMTEHWIYCFVYLVFAVFHILMNREYREYGILK